MANVQEYDSRPETLRHIGRVRNLLAQVVRELESRARTHDASKTEEPELSMLQRAPKLKGSTYGSSEYRANLANLGDGMAHHYANNRHHPEHFDNGLGGMSLIDVVEMLADWKASTERHDDGDIQRSLLIQRDRFDIGPQLQSILQNTVRDLGWAS